MFHQPLRTALLQWYAKPYVFWSGIAVGAGALMLAGLLTIFLWDLPTVASAHDLQPEESTFVLDRNGELLFAVFDEEDREIVPLERIPDHVRHAFVAIEDERFFERYLCVDTRAIGRAALANMTDFKSQGASTITQQLVRTVFLERNKVLRRKVREIALACRIEQILSKDEILHLYLNWISFGSTIHGVQQASRYYFDKDIEDVTVAEAAVLAALPQRPTYFSPHGNHVRSTADTIGLLGTGVTIGNQDIWIGGRAHQVLASMQEQGYISEELRYPADRELLAMQFEQKSRAPKAPHFVLSNLEHLEKKIAISKESLLHDGYIIRTTLDATLQKELDTRVATYAESMKEKYGIHNIAAVLVDSNTRNILAYSGNVPYFQGGTGTQIDMARAPRQPGSSFKPVVYAYAMQQLQWKPYTMLEDSPINLGGYTPKNYDGTYKGEMSLLSALNQSRNIPAIRAYRAVHDETGLLEFAAGIGLTTPRARTGESHAYGWPLAIGSAEVSLMEMVEAYATFANDGIHTPIESIVDIHDAKGTMLYASEPKPRQAMPVSIAQSITSMLSEAQSRPAGYWRSATTLPGIETAVKTGTSNVCLQREGKRCMSYRPRDVWAIGYSPSYVLGIWMGNADGSPLELQASGLGAAIPLWREMLIAAHEQTTNEAVAFTGGNRPYFLQHPYISPTYATDDIEQKPSWIGGIEGGQTAMGM